MCLCLFVWDLILTGFFFLYSRFIRIRDVHRFQSDFWHFKIASIVETKSMLSKVCCTWSGKKELFCIHAIFDITKNTRVVFLYFDSSSYLDVLKEFSGRQRDTLARNSLKNNF